MNFLDKYNINIKDKELLLTALTHTSYANEHDSVSYERLEYLGDAVLEVIISDYLYKMNELSEGDMTKIRASYVCEEALCEYAKDINYLPYIRVGHGQEGNINDTIVADIFEAILGVIYLDQGFDIAKKYIEKIVIPHIKKHDVFLMDYKSALQESVQTDKKTLEYNVIREFGPGHDKTFEVEVVVDNIVFGKGKGKSKKEAEQRAAKDAFSRLAK